MRLLLDTNTLSYILKRRFPATHRMSEAVRGGATFLLCAVVHYELRRYLVLKGSHSVLRLYDDLVRPWERYELSFQDWEHAASMWADRHRVGKSISDLDLLLAVVAMKEKAVLVTTNVRHFEGLGLPLQDWMSAAS